MFLALAAMRQDAVATRLDVAENFGNLPRQSRHLRALVLDLLLEHDQLVLSGHVALQILAQLLGGHLEIALVLLQ